MGHLLGREHDSTGGGSSPVETGASPDSSVVVGSRGWVVGWLVGWLIGWEWGWGEEGEGRSEDV